VVEAGEIFHPDLVSWDVILSVVVVVVVAVVEVDVAGDVEVDAGVAA
jgi:hypothetical protein